MFIGRCCLCPETSSSSGSSASSSLSSSSSSSSSSSTISTLSNVCADGKCIDKVYAKRYLVTWDAVLGATNAQCACAKAAFATDLIIEETAACEWESAERELQIRLNHPVNGVATCTEMASPRVKLFMQSGVGLPASKTWRIEFYMNSIDAFGTELRTTFRYSKYFPTAINCLAPITLDFSAVLSAGGFASCSLPVTNTAAPVVLTPI